MAAYAPTRESLSQRPVPDWFEDDKLGIFIHWGLFSIPGFAPRLRHISDAFTDHYEMSSAMTPYTEWYWNAMRVPESPTAKHHAEHWGGRPYEAFQADFLAGLEQWEPRDWARQFRQAGARYVVLVTKHHDGFCLWPSRVANPHQKDWATERDIVGELADAVRAEGMRFGIYYSGGIDWTFNRRAVRTFVEFIASMPRGDYPAYAEAQVRELIERYSPSIVWNDIAWPTARDPMLRMMADYYEAVPDGVVNDRWMHQSAWLGLLRLRPVGRLLDALVHWKIRRDVANGTYEEGIVPPTPVHSDFRTSEYRTFDEVQERKWEATRGMSASFAWNRNDGEEDTIDPAELVRSFVDTVAKNGNLLLNVGPRGVDAAIPSEQVSRLAALGRWLEQNGEAIYGTRPWKLAEATTREGTPVRFTSRGDTVYATALGPLSQGPESLPRPPSLDGAIRVRRLSDGVMIADTTTSPELVLEAGIDAPAHSFALERTS